MDVLILDDSLENAEIMKKYIKVVNSNFNVLCFNEYDDFFKTLMQIRNCIIFLDIMMPKTGIQISNQIKSLNIDCPIIFYSGMPKELYDVYDGNHVYYIEKPLSTQKVKKAISIALNHITENFFTYSFSKTIGKVPYSQIIYFESNGKIIKLYTTTETHFFYEKLDEVEKRLSTPFIRISKSYLVNPHYINKIVDTVVNLKATKNPDVSDKLTISRTYKKSVIKNDFFIKHN